MKRRQFNAERKTYNKQGTGLKKGEYLKMRRRTTKGTSNENEPVFQVGDEVYIFKGPNKHASGLVFRVMPIMMNIEITNGSSKYDVVKCKQTSARLIKRSEKNQRNKSNGRSNNNEETTKKAKAIKKLHEAVQALEKINKTRIDEIIELLDNIM
jgi:ribosomal protein L24